MRASGPENPCDILKAVFRRISALLLLVLNSLLLTVPVAVAANTKSPEIPACCRRDGKHKCAMTVKQQQQQAGASLAMISDVCPCCPKGSVQASASTADAAFAPERTTFHLPVFALESGLPQTLARQRISEHRAWRKRGPPSHTSNHA